MLDGHRTSPKCVAIPVHAGSKAERGFPKESRSAEDPATGAAIVYGRCAGMYSSRLSTPIVCRATFYREMKVRAQSLLIYCTATTPTHVLQCTSHDEDSVRWRVLCWGRHGRHHGRRLAHILIETGRIKTAADIRTSHAELAQLQHAVCSDTTLHSCTIRCR